MNTVDAERYAAYLLAEMTKKAPEKTRGRGRFSPTGGETKQIRIGSKLAETLSKRAKTRRTTIAVLIASKDF